LLLEVDDAILELDCQIKQAEIRLSAANARLDFGVDFARYKRQPSLDIEHSQRSKRSGSLEGNTNFALSPTGVSGAIDATAKASVSTEDTRSLASAGTTYPFNHIDFHTVSVTGLPGQKFLNGSEVVEYEGWRGTFEAVDKKVGIAASILVREQWLEFSNPDLKGTGRLTKALANIFTSKSSRKAQQFQVLLAFLVRKALQDPSEKKYATLACHAFVLDPQIEQQAVLQRAEQAEKITIHPMLVEQFVGLPAGTHEDFVNSVILADAATDTEFDHAGAQTARKLRAPIASAYDVAFALQHLKDLTDESPTRIAAAIAKLPRNIRRDLSALGFLTASKGRFVDTFLDFQGSPHSALVFAVSETDWFKFTASTLEKNGLRFAAYRVGLEVSLEFGLDWGEASQRRYGHNMKRWVAMLHPKFAQLNKDHIDYWYVRSLKAQAGTKGAIPIIDEELAEEIEYRKLLGRSYKTITEEVGISTGAFTNWKAKNADMAKAATAAALVRYRGEGS